jgi:hypothetical protein
MESSKRNEEDIKMIRFIIWYMKQVERIVERITVPNPEYTKAHEPESWNAEDFLFDR